jgi:hypothetical protein
MNTLKSGGLNLVFGPPLLVDGVAKSVWLMAMHNCYPSATATVWRSSW